MIEVITEISIFITIAIVLGYIFGWLITKAIYRGKIKKLKSEHIEQKAEINKLSAEIERHELEMIAFIEEREELVKQIHSSKN